MFGLDDRILGKFFLAVAGSEVQTANVTVIKPYRDALKASSYVQFSFPDRAGKVTTRHNATPRLCVEAFP